MDNEERASVGERVMMVVVAIIALVVAIWGALLSANDAFALTLWCYIAALDAYLLGREIYRWRADSASDLGKIDGVSRGGDEDGKEEE